MLSWKWKVHVILACFSTLIAISKQSSWVNLGSQLYYINNEKLVNWFGANNACARRGMALIALETKEESDRLKEFLKRTNQDKFLYWSSGNDLEHKNTMGDRQLHWGSLGVPLTFTNWRPGEPNSLNRDEQCVVLEYDFDWNDQNCYIEFFYICESIRANGYLIPSNWNSSISSSADKIYIVT